MAIQVPSTRWSHQNSLVIISIEFPTEKPSRDLHGLTMLKRTKLKKTVPDMTALMFRAVTNRLNFDGC